ncbi:hydrogenase expression/formation protein [Thioalbus denitrificans]|uniref:Hydrogenase-1 operon protein HyaF n=1 Tax=Thioalbus denitrificans TaxID=547122 RepID=A0A369CHU1_9GAMM|nr:hydrogenase expression/formation protein [Thioalbus denitrificans]RCX32848.1 hydrogenase-1 operon protein HyaF [Thioalbus denitrificans]
MKPFSIPVVTLGPGSQAGADDEPLDYLPLPREMTTFRLPELPGAEVLSARPRARSTLLEIRATLAACRAGDPALVVHLDDLDAEALQLVDQVLGEGEVSIRCAGREPLLAQESVLTGVWRLQHLDAAGRVRSHSVEVGDIPRALRTRAFTGADTHLVPVHRGELPEGVINAPPVLVELADHARGYRAGDPNHVINLTLLPQTPEDLAYLETTLGTGSVDILSRGYGNCRITSTRLRNVWWVRHFNSQDLPILTTLEVVDVPAVACAAREDLEDSHERLLEILEVLE